MDVDDLAKTLNAVKILSMKPDDIIVFQFAGALTGEQVEEITNTLYRIIGERRIMIMDQGVDVSVIRVHDDFDKEKVERLRTDWTEHFKKPISTGTGIVNFKEKDK